MADRRKALHRLQRLTSAYRTETRNLQKECCLIPFEGAGVYGTWKLDLPAQFRQFDYNTISDVILHIRCTARQGGALLGQKAVGHLRALVEDANASGLVQLFSLRHDFPAEWRRFITGTSNFVATVKRDYFPYLTLARNISIASAQVAEVKRDQSMNPVSAGIDPTTLNDSVTEFELSLEREDLSTDADAQVFLVIKYVLEPA